MLRQGGLTFPRVCVVVTAVVALLAAATSLGASSANASRSLQVGIFDDGSILGDPDTTFPLLKQLRTQVIRVSLDWGGLGALSVARRKPEKATDPADPAYRWTAYDYIVKKAAENKIKVLFSVIGTPRWANGGKRWNHAPTSGASLRAFMYAAAKRYSGTFTPEGADQPLPAVRLWLAWNEPNDPIFLAPQYRKVGKKYVLQSARDYARICNAVVTGVHSTLLRGEKVACGATGPRGNDKPAGTRASVSPLGFLRAMKRAGATGFDAYAHHPYYGNPHEGPTTAPRSGVTLANIGKLINEVTKLYGPKRIWITEYGYQTKPPDPLFGISWALQARYLARAYSIARKNPRIDMMIWFLLRDEPRSRGHDGWQSGLMTHAGKKKPAYTTFRRLPH
jgi:Glycosyl hydrolase catalytic core